MTKKLDKILVPVDGSDAAYRALEFAAKLADHAGAVLEIANVLDLRQVDIYEGFYLTEKQLETLEQNVHEKILGEAQGRIPEGVKVETRLVKGPTLQALLQAAEDDGADLVVMGRTGKNAFERVFEGSVSRGMATHCKVPVTIVP